jgi:pimeloyl-ACP methyl ester carboxylesterase
MITWSQNLPAEQLLIAILAFGSGLIFWFLLAVIEYGAWALILPVRLSEKSGDSGEQREDVEQAAGTKDRGTPIRVTAADGAKLAARWHPAGCSEPTGRTVILLHGFADNSDAMEDQRLEVLSRQGWNVATLELRGYGESEGPFASFGGREAADIGCWLNALGERVGPDLRLEPVLWGRSMGAAIALRTAAEDSRVKALILESPMVDLNAAVTVWFRKRRLPFPGLLAKLVTRRAGKLAGVSITRPRPIELAPRVRCPVLIVRGSNDRLVSEPEVLRLADALPHPPRILDIPGAGHSDVAHLGGDAFINEVISFLSEAGLAPRRFSGGANAS